MMTKTPIAECKFENVRAITAKKKLKSNQQPSEYQEMKTRL